MVAMTPRPKVSADAAAKMPLTSCASARKGSGKRYFVPDWKTPLDVEGVMKRRYGSPITWDGGEVAYWDVSSDMTLAR